MKNNCNKGVCCNVCDCKHNKNGCDCDLEHIEVSMLDGNHHICKSYCKNGCCDSHNAPHNYLNND
ncbi:MAG: hypothetical protein IJA69_02430 [Clostridia bacterium]|nr:hypothetical protein [Clostridia bacterium]